MSEETWTITMGDKTYAVPRLPFKVSRVVYPICQRLSNAELPKRILMPTSPLVITDEEMNDLGTLALLGCQAADPLLTEEDFESMPITPPQLFDAFLAMRHACGGWRIVPEGQEPQGEGTGTDVPPT